MVLKALRVLQVRVFFTMDVEKSWNLLGIHLTFAVELRAVDC